MAFSKVLSFKKNNALLAATFVMLFVAVVNYYLYFDVLAPDINVTGSLKQNMGALFVFPVLVLAAIQLVYAAGVLHLVIRSFYFEKRDFLKALFVASWVILLFSGYYTLVPTWGPYSFLTGAYRNVPSYTYLLLTGWTALLLLGTTLLIKRLYSFKKGEIRPTILLLLASSIFIVVMAFATG